MPRLHVGEILERRSGEELALNQAHLNPQLGRVLSAIGYDRRWVSGEGAHLVDARGERFLDLVAGHGVFAVGRNNRAVRAQLQDVLARDTPNLPQLGVTLLAGVLAEQLLARAPARLERVVYANSGAEAVEAAIKLARRATGRAGVVACRDAFHGLTLGALSLNGSPVFREGFGPLLPGCSLVGFGDLDALERALAARDVAAFVVEPVQGKGVHLPPPGYLEAAQELCRRHGTLLVLDEVQTGLGRTGRFLALEHWGLEPDMVTLAKALSGGYVPIGAVLVTRGVAERVFDRMERAVVHGSTFAGSDLAAAAGLATLSELDDAELVCRARRLGKLLLELTRPLVERHEIVRDVRGLGLMWALELGPPRRPAGRSVWRMVEARQPGLAAQLVTVPLLAEHRILIQVAGHHISVIKALPPLVVEEADIRRFAAALDDVLARAEHIPRAMARFGMGMARRTLGRREPRRPERAGSRR